MLKLEPRSQPSRAWSYGSPLLALAITVLIGVALFAAGGSAQISSVKAWKMMPANPY